MISNAHVKCQGSSLKAERRLWTARRLYTISLAHGKTRFGERTVNLAFSHHPAHGSLHISIKSSQRNMCRHKTQNNSLTVLWQNGDNHHTGQFGPLSATVAPFEEREKGEKIPNLRYRVSPSYHTLAVLFLPFSSSTTFPELDVHINLQS